MYRGKKITTLWNKNSIRYYKNLNCEISYVWAVLNGSEIKLYNPRTDVVSNSAISVTSLQRLPYYLVYEELSLDIINKLRQAFNLRQLTT